jgi:hypothetical protein
MTNAAAGSGGDKSWGLVLVVPACVALFILFIVLTLVTPDKKTAAQPLEPGWYTPTTARGEDLKHKVMVGNCFLCHAYWTGIPDPDVVRPLFAHAAITLDHGANDRCYNCHLIQDRNKFTADDGSGIMASNVQELCARCHGLIYNDWVAGTHGVRRGQWMAPAVFERQNFKCTQCHDPHAPKFQFGKYAPPPVWPEHLVRRRAEASPLPQASE